jgi:UDP-glucose 4-epimerase
VKVLVTGGAGFIGMHLLRDLIEGGNGVVVLDNFHRGDRATITDMATGGRVCLIEGDIRDRSTVREALRGVQRVYHLAAQSNVLGAVSDIEYSFTTNVVGTYNVLLAGCDEGVERIVFTSSREVYGEVDRLPVAEDRPLDPKNPYGASKVAGEAYCRVFATTYGLDVSVLRLANVYGPGDRGRVIPIWLHHASEGRDLEVYGGGQVLDFVPIALTVAAIKRAGEMSLGGQPVNVGSGVETPLLDLAERIRQLPGARVGIRRLPARTVEVSRFTADVARMRTMLGLTPPTDPLTELSSLWEVERKAPS